MIISLNTKQSVREQVEEALMEEIKRNLIALLKHGWEVYIAVFAVDGGVIVEIGERAIGIGSGEEEHFQTAFFGFMNEKDIDLAMEWGVIEYDGANHQFVSVIDRNPDGFKKYLYTHTMLNWENLEQLAKDLWSEILNKLKKEVEEKQYRINEITAHLDKITAYFEE